MAHSRSLIGTLARRAPILGRLLADLERTQARLAAARTTAAAYRARADLLQARSDRLRRRVERLESQVRALKLASAARVPVSAVLEQSLGVRLAALAQSSRRLTARVLEQRLATRSSAYRDAVGTGDRRVERCDGPIVAHGLRWWIPRQAVTDPNGLEARVAAGRLPLKTILATRELAQGAVMLDIGANIGTTSIPRVVLGDFQYIYAAEPEPANYACLVQNVVTNGLGGFVLPDRVAIGAADGEVTMEVAANMGAHRVVGNAALGPAENRVVVPARRLDTWIESLDIDPLTIAFIKCDVQGWETHVLSGAIRTLAHRHVAWQFEVSPKHLRHAGSSLEEFCDAVRRHFDCFIDLDGNGRRARSTTELEASLDGLGQKRRFTDILAYNTTAG